MKTIKGFLEKVGEIKATETKISKNGFSPDKPRPLRLFGIAKHSSEQFLESVECYANGLHEQKIDITASYKQWVRIGFAFVNTYGEAGREIFHKVSSSYPKYDRSETDRLFSDCISHSIKRDQSKPKVTVATFIKLAQAAGIKCNQHGKN